MKLTLDSDRSVLTLEDTSLYREMPLYGREAFELLSREWVRVGWALRCYFTFTWLGQPILQLPEDLIRLQEVICSLRPDVIIETGVYGGGSLLFHATICEALGNGRVIGIDRLITDETRKGLAGHRVSNRIEAIEGDSTAAGTIAKVRASVRKDESVMVILDSHHSADHVARELEVWAPFVTPGSCVLVADGIMRDLADVPGGQPEWVHDNPATAAREFAASHAEFEMRQPAWRHHLSPLEQNVTYWPDGWLWRR